MSKRRTVLIGVVAVMLLTAGCLGAGDDIAPDDGDVAEDAASLADDAPDEAPEAEAGVTFSAGDDDVEAADSASGGRDRTSSMPADRQLIRTGTIALEVDSYSESSDEVQQLAADYDGYVSDTSQETADRHNESWTRGVIEIRVPADSFDEAVRDVRDLGTVEHAETSTDDVTDQLVDIEARLENHRAERDRLRELYDDANETQDVLAVQRELSSVQEEIERLEARQRALEDDVAYSTITVAISEPVPDPPETEEPEAWYETGVVTAFLESVSGVVLVIRASVVGAAYLAPYVLVFGTPIIGAAAFLRYRRGSWLDWIDR